MNVHFVEATNGPQNWGKFAVCQFTEEEWAVLSEVDQHPLLAGRGWGKDHYLVIDLQTGEGAFFPAWMHSADLQKHAIWVCPMFEHAALAILDGEHNPMDTPRLLDFPDAPFEWAGYRRQGPDSDVRVAGEAVLAQWNSYIGVDEDGDDDVMAMGEAIGKLRVALHGDEERLANGPTPAAKAFLEATPEV